MKSRLILISVMTVSITQINAFQWSIRTASFARCLQCAVEPSINVIHVTRINGWRSLLLSVLSLRLAEACGRPYQLGSEGGRGLLAHSASNKFLTPPGVKQPKILTTLYFRAISRIWKSAINDFFWAIWLWHSNAKLVVWYLWSLLFVSNTVTRQQMLLLWVWFLAPFA